MKTIGLLLILLTSSALLSQTIAVEGRIVNDKGLPLQNAVIKVDGVKTIAYSDAADYSKLIFSPMLFIPCGLLFPDTFSIEMILR
ncbi:MAG: hypothetical protein IPM77_11530 [Crocinitomicaceae bacterium]|nr:hypothetical protein [Crocinitomicaceae bacterium]